MYYVADLNDINILSLLIYFFKTDSLKREKTSFFGSVQVLVNVNLSVSDHKRLIT